MAEQIELHAIGPVRQPSVADQVFDALYRQVVTLELPPGARLSEAEVARRIGTSRQPVRDAFYRLSQLGFMVIRPQRSTAISRISEAAVLQARFVRTALEVETVRVAAEMLDAAAFARLDALVADQAGAVAAGDKLLFHALDDEFHRQICALSGLEFAWSLIRENKAHMDRVRYLSLAFGAETALADHREILAALKSRDAARAIAEMRRHLARIETIIGRIRREHGDYFDPAA
jgi:GntR family transcriptional regulator, rspAB operon transcriptional repressor